MYVNLSDELYGCCSKPSLVQPTDRASCLAGQKGKTAENSSANEHKKDDLDDLFDSEMSREAEGGRLTVYGRLYMAARDDTVTGAAGKQLRRDAKRPSLVLITHAGTRHCVQSHTHRLTSLPQTCTHNRWHSQPARSLCLLKAAHRRCQHGGLRIALNNFSRMIHTIMRCFMVIFVT